MACVTLLQALPRETGAGETVAVRIAGGGSRAYTQLGFTDWRAGIASKLRVKTSVGFDQTGFTGDAVPQSATIRFFPSDRTLLTTLSRLYWPGALITVAEGDDEAAAPVYSVTFKGTVADITIDGGAMTITLADLSLDLQKPVLPDTFAGTGGLEGGDDATGRAKRRSWGYVFNVEGQLLDSANNIYEFGDPGRPIEAFAAVKDMGAVGVDPTVVGWQGSAAATFTALQNASPPNGGAAVAPSIACVKWWTVPAGPLTADIQGEVGIGYVQSAPDIAARIATTYSANIAIGNLAEAFGWQPAVSGVHCADATETAASLLHRLLIPVGLIWVMQADGTLAFRNVSWDVTADTVDADTISRGASFAPLKTRTVGFQRNYREQSDSEIAATLLDATDVTYADGTPLEVLKPAEAGANVTGAHVAAAITGQGPGATADAQHVLNSYLTIGADGTLAGGGGGQVTYGGLGGGALGLLQLLTFGSTYLLEQAGGAVATLGAFKTGLGIAAGFTGQSPWATLTASTGRVSALTETGFMPAANVFLAGVNYLANVFPAEYGANVTEGRTAAAISGQGALATLSTLANGSGYLTGFGALSSRNAADLSDGSVTNLYAEYLSYYSTGQTVASLRPSQAGADVTGSNTAAAISGQGAFATYGGSIASLLAPSNNIYKYPRPLPGLTTDQYGWVWTVTSGDGGGWGALYAGNYQPFGGLIYQRDRAGNFGACTIRSYTDIAVDTGPYTASVAIVPAGYSGIRVFFQVINANGDALETAAGTYNSTSARWQVSVANGTGNGVKVRLLIDADYPAANGYQNLCFFAIKVEPGITATAYVEMSSNTMVSAVSALYGTGATVASLKPAQAGADATGQHTAAAITGQGSFATAPQLNSSNVFGGYFALNAFSLNYTITRSDGSSTVTESLVVTQIGVAAAILGQGALATKSTATATDLASGAVGQASLFINDNRQTFSANASWQNVASMSLTPALGQPVKGVFSGLFTHVNSTNDSQASLRVVRDDGTPVKLGAGGKLMNVSAYGSWASFSFVDTVAAGRNTTWSVQMFKANSDTVAVDGAEMDLQETSAANYQTVTITAPSGTGPGAGSGGGGAGGGFGGIRQ